MLALATRAFARHVDGDGDDDDSGGFARRRRAAVAVVEVAAAMRMRHRRRWRVMNAPTARRDVWSRPPRGARFARRARRLRLHCRRDWLTTVPHW